MEETQGQTLQDPSLQEVQDPIQDPTVRKDPKVEQDNLTPDHPRFKEMTKNWRDEQRRGEELQRNFDEQQKVLDSLVIHNKTLDSEIQRQKSSVDERHKIESTSSINKQLRELRAAKRTASQEENWAELDSVEEAIDELKQQTLLTEVNKLIPDPNKLYKEFSETQQRESFETASQSFETSTPWYQRKSPEYNQEMAGFAIGLEGLLMTEYPNVTERLAEVKKRVEKQFNWKGAGVEQPMNLSVEPGVRTKTNQTEVRLTPDDEEMIQRLYKDDPEGRKRFIAQKVYIQKMREN